MRESMKYDTNVYQLRESVLKRMIQIIQQQRYIQDNSIVFYGDSIIEYYDVEHVFKDLGPVYNCGIGGLLCSCSIYPSTTKIRCPSLRRKYIVE